MESITELAPGLAEHREVWERRAILSADTSLGVAELEMPLRVEQAGPNSLQIAGTAYHLDIDITSRQGAAEISWRLRPGGADARSRLAVLNLVHVLHGHGPLVVRDPEFGDIELLRLRPTSPPGPVEDELALYRSIVLVEEWSGYRLRLPDRISQAAAARAWQVAWTIRDRALTVTFLSDIEATITDPANWRAARELRFIEPYVERLFGVDVFLGRLDYRVPVQPISAGPTQDGMLRVTYRPEPTPVTVPLEPTRPDSAQRVAEIEAGEIPSPPPVQPDPEKLARARTLLGELQREAPPDLELRRQLRNQWPTR